MRLQERRDCPVGQVNFVGGAYQDVRVFEVPVRAEVFALVDGQERTRDLLRYVKLLLRPVDVMVLQRVQQVALLQLCDQVVIDGVREASGPRHRVGKVPQQVCVLQLEGIDHDLVKTEVLAVLQKLDRLDRVVVSRDAADVRVPEFSLSYQRPDADLGDVQPGQRGLRIAEPGQRALHTLVQYVPAFQNELVVADLELRAPDAQKRIRQARLRADAGHHPLWLCAGGGFVGRVLHGRLLVDREAAVLVHLDQ